MSGSGTQPGWSFGAVALGCAVGVLPLVSVPGSWYVAGLLGLVGIGRWVARREWSSLGLLLLGMGFSWTVGFGRALLENALNSDVWNNPSTGQFFAAGVAAMALGAGIARVTRRRGGS
jgi:hypothetical protein